MQKKESFCFLLGCFNRLSPKSCSPTETETYRNRKFDPETEISASESDFRFRLCSTPTVNADLDWYPIDTLVSGMATSCWPLIFQWSGFSNPAGPSFCRGFPAECSAQPPHTKPSINQTVAKATHFAKGATFHAAKMKTTKFADIMFTTYARVCQFYHSWEDHWMLIDTIKMILGDFWDIFGVKSWVKIPETCLACWM